MSKRNSRQSSKLSEQTPSNQVVEEEEIPEEKITKKSFNSTTKTTTTTTKNPTKSNEKEPVKMTLPELKNLKNLRKKQEVILMNIENNNIKDHVSKLLTKFDPPYCTNCPNRRADRVCINKACGGDRYMQIICGKCHFAQHQSSINKPEIDVEEFFIKLSTFLNEAKFDDKKKQLVQRIDLDNLETIFDDLDLFRQKLASLKSQIENEIESYTSPMEMQGQLQNSITKALSLCEYDNIQEQLLNVKKSVLFDKNKFFWNDSGEKHKSYQKIFKNLDDTTIQTKSKISKSFVGGSEIYLDDLVVKLTKQQNSTISNNTEYKGQDGEIRIASSSTGNTQFCLDYDLEPGKKYKFRFRFETNPSQYIFVGLVEKRKRSSEWMCNVPNQNFVKRFFSANASTECSRVLKGVDFVNSVVKGQQIEMRVDLENDYVDFYDYPEMKNVNANLSNNKFTKGEDYVFSILFYNVHTVVLESFSEIAVIDDIELK